MVKHKKSEVKREIKEAKRKTEQQVKSDKTVAKNAHSINSNTDSLLVVWNLARYFLFAVLNSITHPHPSSHSQINDDINVIETQLKACVAGRSPMVCKSSNLRSISNALLTCANSSSDDEWQNFKVSIKVWRSHCANTRRPYLSNRQIAQDTLSLCDSCPGCYEVASDHKPFAYFLRLPREC